MSYETRYAAMMRQRIDAASNTPEAALDRDARRRAGSMALAARLKRFPVLTAENAEEAIEFQDAQFNKSVEEIRRELGLIA